MINVEFSLCAVTGVWIYWLFYCGSSSQNSESEICILEMCLKVKCVISNPWKTEVVFETCLKIIGLAIAFGDTSGVEITLFCFK